MVLTGASILIDDLFCMALLKEISELRYLEMSLVKAKSDFYREFSNL